jgi:acetyl esterase/lipase
MAVHLLWSRYNLPKLVDHFNERGLYRSIFLSVMEGEESLPLFSPELLVLSPSFQESVPLLPPVALFHGTADCSILCEASVAFGNALRSVGAKATTTLYAQKTHTDLFLQVCCFSSTLFISSKLELVLEVTWKYMFCTSWVVILKHL